MAYVGEKIPLEILLSLPNHSLIHQSLNARQLALPSYKYARQFRNHDFPTQGEGFGMAWIRRDGTVGRYRDTQPAWDSQNFPELAAQIESSCFLSHVRAAPGGSVAADNNHPFVHDGWMFQHNGGIGGFEALKRELTFDVAPALYPFIRGNTDSEVCFYLALTYGLASDPVKAMHRMRERVEQARMKHQVGQPFEGSFAASDGEVLVAMRTVSTQGLLQIYSDAQSPSLYWAEGPVHIRMDDGNSEELPAGSFTVVSEPPELHYAPRTWHQFPDQSIGIFRRGQRPHFYSFEMLSQS